VVAGWLRRLLPPTVTTTSSLTRRNGNRNHKPPRPTLNLHPHPSQRHGYKQHIHLLALATHPDAAGRGLGQQLMSKVLESADKEGLPVYLEAAPTGVEGFYTGKYGFEKIGGLRMDFPYGGFEMPLLLRRPPQSSGEQ